jgi:phosphate starvation-inducible PhoH-like protein
MAETTVHFDNAREIQDVLGKRAEFLSRIERAFGVRLTTRDTWLRAEGAEDDIAKAGRFFDCMRRARNSGTLLREHSVMFALKAFTDGRKTIWRSCTTAGSTFRRASSRSFRARSGNYLCGFHPDDRHRLRARAGGNGENLSGHGQAVAALEGRRQPHHPDPAGREAGEALGFLPGDLHQKVPPTCVRCTTRSTT